MKWLVGGEGGIRTPGTLARTPHFECGAIDHSATSPQSPRRAQWRRRFGSRRAVSMAAYRAQDNVPDGEGFRTAAVNAGRGLDGGRRSKASHGRNRGREEAMFGL